MHTATAVATATAPHGNPTSPRARTAARIAGGAYAAMFVLAVLANLVVIEGLVVADDPTATLAALTADRGLFRLGILAFLVIAVLDVVVAWALHVLLREHGRDRSTLAATLRVVYGVVLALSLAPLLRADALVAGAAGDGTAAEVAVALATFDLVWQVGLLFFGLHLLVVASLLRRRPTAPRGLAVVLGVTAAVYVVDALLQVGMTDYAAIAGVLLPVVAVPSVVAEGWFTGWLLLRAGREGQPRRSAMKR